MRNLADTLSRLKRQSPSTLAASAQLKPTAVKGANPGNLTAFIQVPERRLESPGLVIVLHGCTQTAATYDHGAGWSRLADRHGFIVLFPEQQRANNPGLCFNWFSPEDVRRGGGEAASIRSMIEQTVMEHDIDRDRIFITGLSAGGAMTSAMLAAYPEVFAGGAIIAGLPHGSAASMPEAFDRMRGHGVRSASESVADVLRASDHQGPWPSVWVWHGDADTTVAPANADAIVEQWRGVHRAAHRPDEARVTGRDTVRVWRSSTGRTVLEDHRIAGMGHGTPVDTRGRNAVGTAGPFMLDVGVCSSAALVKAWGLTGSDASDPAEEIAGAEVVDHQSPVTRPRKPERLAVQAVIEAALRRAGLMP